MKMILLLTSIVLGFALTTDLSAQTQKKVILQTEWTAEYMKFRDEACKSFLEKSKKVNDEFKLADYDHWDFQQDTGQIVFSDKGVKKVIADVQIAGDWGPRNGTWMWGWNNSSLDRPLTKEVERVKALGKEKNFPELVTPEFIADPEYCLKLAAVAGQIIGAKTAYRGKNGSGYVYFLITDLKWVK